MLVLCVVMPPGQKRRHCSSSNAASITHTTCSQQRQQQRVTTAAAAAAPYVPPAVCLTRFLAAFTQAKLSDKLAAAAGGRAGRQQQAAVQEMMQSLKLNCRRSGAQLEIEARKAGVARRCARVGMRMRASVAAPRVRGVAWQRRRRAGGRFALGPQ